MKKDTCGIWSKHKNYDIWLSAGKSGNQLVGEEKSL